MKWAAGILAIMLYFVWPYYTLLELGQVIRSGDAPAINRLVDWTRVRTSVKAQIQAKLQNAPKTAAQQDFAAKYPAFDGLGLTFANSIIDSMLTPEGVTRLIQGARNAAPAVPASQQVSDAKPTSADTGRQASLWQRIRFAFFVSPIDFRIDVSDPDQSAAQPTLTVMLMFKGTGWQVSELRLPGFNTPQKVAMAPN
jgi:Protein of unknown function (DUF2939)